MHTTIRSLNCVRLLIATVFRAKRIGIAMGAVALAACSGSPADATDPPGGTPGNATPFSSFSVNPVAPAVQVGQTVQLSASYQAAAGATVVVTYASQNTGVVTVNPAGLVTAVASGAAEVRITATGSGTGFSAKQETLPVTVTVTAANTTAALITFAVAPATHTMAVGATVQLVPQPVLAGTGVTVSYTYQSSSNSVATVTPAGTVSGVASGQAVITATATGSGAGFTTTVRTATMTLTVGAVTGLTAAVELTAGLWNTCAREASGKVWCWGDGVLGNGLLRPDNAYTPAMPAFPSNITVATVSAGWDNYCAITTTASTYCWGLVSTGSLGIGTNSDATVPTLVIQPAGTQFKQVSSGWAGTSCALTTAGIAYCWGDNSFGSVGDSTTISRVQPTLVRMPGGVTFSQISAGSGATCAVSTAGDVYCWGSVLSDLAGVPEFGFILSPRQLSVVPGVKFSKVATGSGHSCALSTVGDIYCQGTTDYGVQGNGQTTGAAPVRKFSRVNSAAGVVFTSVGVGTEHSCALSGTGDAYCWGRNRWGNVGDSTVTDRVVPTRVRLPAGVTLAGLAVGWEHNCGWTAAGAIYCWGRNQYGQLGDISKTNRTTPYKFR